MVEDWEWEWFTKMNPTVWTADTRGIVGRIDGKIAAMAVVQTILEGCAQVHLVVENPFICRHGFIEAVFNTAFGVSRPQVLAWTPSDHEKALKLNKHLGFKEIGRVPNGLGPGSDYILLRLGREECRYLGG